MRLPAPRQTLLLAFLLSSALGASLFFQGGGLTPLALALSLLVAALVVALWFPARVIVPRTPITILLALFFGWLALGLAGSRVAASSIINFWWLGCLPLGFWIVQASGDSARLVRWVGGLAAVLCSALAVMALWQAFVAHTVPESLFLNTNSQDALFNLVILPALGLWLNREARGRRWAWASALVAALLVFTIGVTGERGPVVALVLGLGVLLWVGRGTWPGRAWMRAPLLVVFALAAADLAQRGSTGARLATVAHPVSALATRLVIWKGAWRLAVHVPWHGVGLGLFGLAYPPYRLFGDTSAGFFAHDDYLQLYIEAGWPALLLLLGLLGAVVWMFRQGLLRWPLEDGRRAAAGALFAALFATAAHSLVDFNFYIPSIDLLMGVELAALHHLLWRPPAATAPRRAPVLSLAGYRTLLVLLALLPLSYFVALAWSDRDYAAGVQAAARADWIAADRLLARAQRLFPDSDTIELSRGDLARQLLFFLPANTPGRKVLYAAARRRFARAHAENPLRPESLRLWGELEDEHPRLAGAHPRARALGHFEAALALDPRDFRARFDAIELRMHEHRLPAAHALAEAGIHYWYPPSPAVLPYLGLTAALRTAQGDTLGAGRLRERIAAIGQAFPESARARHTEALGLQGGRGWDLP